MRKQITIEGNLAANTAVDFLSKFADLFIVKKAVIRRLPDHNRPWLDRYRIEVDYE